MDVPLSTIGIDVSNNNRPVITKLDVNTRFVFAKCTEGTSFVDSTYAHYAQLAESHGEQFGAYHFFHAETLNARAQANFFADHCRPRTFLSLWVDYETYGASGQVDAGQLGLFIAQIKLRYPHAKVGVYANTVGFERIDRHMGEVACDAIWYANPSIPMGEQPPKLPVWQVHQYATVNGVDHNISVWTPTELRDYFAW